MMAALMLVTTAEEDMMRKAISMYTKGRKNGK